jgi:hypothetical protein
MNYTLLPLLTIGAAIFAAVFALWKGDTPARVAGVVSAINAIALPVARMALQAQVGEVLQLTFDFFWAVGLLVLAVRYASLWLGATMLLQAAQFSLHAFYLVMERPHDLIHAWINNINTVGISICIVVGTVTAIRRRVVIAREEAEREARRQKLSAKA